MKFSDDSRVILAEEIARAAENFSFSILVLSENDNSVIAEAVVAIWIMIEDSVNIARNVILYCLKLAADLNNVT